MRLIPRQLTTQIFTYESSKTRADLVQEIQNIFSEKWYDLSTNLSGKFITDSEFYVVKKYSAVFSDSGTSGHTAIKGKLRGHDNKIFIDLVVKPNPAMFVWTTIPVVLGLFFLNSIIFHSDKIEFGPLLIAILFTTLVSLAALFYGQHSKDELRNRFIETLKLKRS